MKKLEDRVACITGGASGIGRALCELFARNGAITLVADINRRGAEEVAAALRQRGQRATAVALDVSHEADVQQAVTEVMAKHGRLDFMINNAAIAIVGEIRDGNMADFRRLMDVNF